MQYGHVIKAIFLERPNRFIAHCQVAGDIQKVHVKNTGRCKELLVPGAVVYLEECDYPNRKTKYSLIAVEKEGLLINMDSQAPNQVVEEALRADRIKLPDLSESIQCIRREKTYGQSRFDFYLETESKKVFIEVKGVTLEEDGIVRFPDAPTERGVKHINELISASQEGYMCYVLFVIQMEKARYFTPHRERHPEFANILVQAAQNGVGILAYTCEVEPDRLTLSKAIEVKL